MATTNFRIAVISVTSAPAEPPLYAWPTVYASPVVQYPKPTRSNGYNYPAGIVGLPFCILGREKISDQGIAYYNALFSTATSEYTRVKASLYDQRTQSWLVYTGTLWRPEHKESVPGKAYWFKDFKATIVDLKLIANWSVVST